MRYWTSAPRALALLAATGGAAFAQVPPAPEPPPPPAPEPPPPAAPAPPAPPPPAVPTPPPGLVQPAPPPAAAPVTPSEGDARRPGGLSFAIGLGYQLPTSLQTPNVTSVRIRLASGFTVEPRLALAKTAQDIDTGPSVVSDASELGVGALARYPLVRRGRVDLELLGGVDLDRLRASPDDPDQALTLTTTTAVYGFAVGAWITPHWQVSLSAQNPLLSLTRRDEQMGFGTSTVTTNYTVGLIFDPTVAVMIHLYH